MLSTHEAKRILELTQTVVSAYDTLHEKYKAAIDIIQENRDEKDEVQENYCTCLGTLTTIYFTLSEGAESKQVRRDIEDCLQDCGEELNDMYCTTVVGNVYDPEDLQKELFSGFDGESDGDEEAETAE